jgi:hypothetical protein
MALLLSIVRRALGTERDGHLRREAYAAVDWPRLLTTALGHGVMPLLHAGLSNSPAEVPAATRDELRRHFRANAQANLFRAGELVRLLAVLDEHGIQAVPLKGPVLAMSNFGSLAMRQFADLDLFVRREHAPSAAAVLRSVGYNLRSSADTSITVVRAGGPCPVVVDLQWSLAEDRYSFPLDAQQVGRRLTRVRFMNGTVSQPALDDQLLILCAHPAKHCWSKLEWVVDLAAFIQANGDRIDWPAALDRARRVGACRLLLLAIGLTQHLLRQQPPVEVQASIRADRIVGRLVSEISGNLCESPADLNRLTGMYGLVEAGLLYMRTRERIADKLPYLRFLGRLFREWCTFAPNERDYGVVRLPPYLRVLYFAIRPMRLLWKYGGRLLRSGLQAPASLR